MSDECEVRKDGENRCRHQPTIRKAINIKYVITTNALQRDLGFNPYILEQKLAIVVLSHYSKAPADRIQDCWMKIGDIYNQESKELGEPQESGFSPLNF